MFERYTEKARRVIFFARYEASLVGSHAIEPEHLLLGICREDRALLTRLVPSLTSESLRQEVEKRRPPAAKPIHTSVELPLANVTKRILSYAHEESDLLNHRHIGTEHFLLGLLREDNSVAAQLLLEHRGLKELRELLAKGEYESETMASFIRGVPAQSSAENFWLRQVRNHGTALIALADNLLSGNVKVGTKYELRERKRVTLGVEKLLEEGVYLLKGARVGLICNQASVDHRFQHAADLFHSQSEVNLTALFGPQHGIRGDVQDNMIETEHSIDRQTGLPIHSLYSETREPTEKMLKDVDVLVFDMQDVGCRIYTFVYTLANCMRAAKQFNKRVIVCDRPNPINGVQVSGNVLEPEQASFVGQFPIPTRHGMTVGELAELFNKHFKIGCELEVVTMNGWKREYWHDETDAPWVIPSPNMPTLDTATVFPGTVHFEGTQMSEGRGTTRPFELVGAPYIVPEDYAARLNSLGFSEVFFRSCAFMPTFQKHAGVACGGVQIHVLNRAEFEPVSTGIAMVKTAYEMYSDQFQWKKPPYEYVHDRNPFDVISGTSKIRKGIEKGETLESITQSWQEDLDEFKRVRTEYLLYE